MIGTIETAIVQRIAQAHDSGVLGYELKKIASYGGDLSDQLNQVVRGLPAIWVIFAGETKLKSYANGAREQSMARFSVIAAAKSLRNEAGARHGSGNAVGSYQMVKDIKALLSGQTLGLDIGRLEYIRTTPLFNNKSDKDLASIYGLEFQTPYISDYGTTAASLDDFETFHANWDVPVLGNVGPVIPDDAAADATDTVTLETAP